MARRCCTLQGKILGGNTNTGYQVQGKWARVIEPNCDVSVKEETKTDVRRPSEARIRIEDRRAKYVEPVGVRGGGKSEKSVIREEEPPFSSTFWRSWAQLQSNTR